MADLNLRDLTQRGTYWQGSRFEYPTCAILKSWADDGADKIFFDIGSNYGFFSYWMLSNVPNIRAYAFEPNAATYSILERIRDSNALDRLSTWNIGLSDVAGRLELHPGHEDSGHSTFGDHPGLTEQTLPAVNVMPFEEWRLSQRMDLPVTPSWIAKIDVEGFELKVLRGMETALKARAFRGLVVEINEFTLSFCGARPGEVFEFLRECGYESLATKENGNRWPLHKTANAFFEPAAP